MLSVLLSHCNKESALIWPIACAGAVRLECEEGCTCKPREYSLRHWNHVSLVYWKPLLNVELINGTETCVIRVTNPVRNSTERKLKVRLPSSRPPSGCAKCA